MKAPTQASARVGTAQELSSAQRRPVYYAYDLRGDYGDRITVTVH